MRVITIALGPHRAEMLCLMEKHMRRCRVVILEEPAHPGFHDMLRKETGIRRYLAGGGFGFPRFVLRACRLHQRLYSDHGISFFQIDPYMTAAKNLMEGNPPRSDLEYKVWTSEHICSNALLRYYEAASTGDFNAMVEATTTFAQADARRIFFRETLRSRAIAGIVRDTEGDVYIEAGYIHLILQPLLKKQIPAPEKPRVLFLLREPIGALSNLAWRQHLSPGDVLTLRRIFGRAESPADTLLAARSLVFVSLLSKEEKLPSPADPYPHLLEELYLCRWVRKMTYEDCAEFYNNLKSNSSP
ncbi:MAG: hypothetical protein AB1500_00790 [Bacillota bacterium]